MSAAVGLAVAALGSARVLDPPVMPVRVDADRYDQPQEAQDFFVLKRSPDGRSPLDYSRYRAAIEHSKRMPRYATATDEALLSENRLETLSGELKTWSPLGPGNVGGRTRGLVVDPTDGDVMYAAGVAGGIWKTTNGGGAWKPLNDFMGNLAVSVLTMDPDNRNVIYAGTGEGFFNSDAVRGGGIFRTTDAGANWETIGGTASNTNFRFVNDIVVSSNDSQKIYAATRTGVFRSLDGGANWSGPLAGIAAANGCTDLVIRTDTGPEDTVLVACGAASAGFQGALYRNTDAGGAGVWTAVRSLADQGRTSLAIAPSDQDVVYALSASSATTGTFARGGLLNVARSDDGGATFSTQVDNTSATKLNTLLLSNPRDATWGDCFRRRSRTSMRTRAGTTTSSRSTRAIRTSSGRAASISSGRTTAE